MKVSVIVANYNSSRYIGQTIRSLLTQSMPKEDYEIVAVDDGSTDISRTIMEPYLDVIRLFVGSHEGHIAACNEGFKRSRGQYIVRVDADDYVNKDFLALEALFLEENKAFDAVACDYYKVDEKGNRLMRCEARLEPIACGVMFRREALFADGLYGEAKVWEDTEFVSRFCQNGHTVYWIPLPLYRYVQHGDSLTHRRGGDVQ